MSSTARGKIDKYRARRGEAVEMLRNRRFEKSMRLPMAARQRATGNQAAFQLYIA